MGFGKHVRGRGCLRSRRSRLIAAAAALAVILIAVLPPAIIVSRREDDSMGPKAKVFVPLYVYPVAGAWDPLVNV